MIDKVLCPYCGSEMKSEDWVKVDGGYLSYAVCSNDACQSIGPTVTGYETTAEARAAALAAAKERYLPPNRPLTLDEVKALERDDMGYAIAWTENRRDEENHPWPYVEADCVPKFAEYFEEYGKEYRVWLRKPTQAEMDAAGWGGRANND